MDTETLIQRLSEYQVLLNRFQQALEFPLVSKEAALENIRGQVLWLFEADQIAQTRQEPDEDLLLRWALRTEQRLLEESLQHLTLLQEVLQNSPAGLAVVCGPDLVFQLATPTYRGMLPYPYSEIIGQPYEAIWPADQGFGSGKLIQQMRGGGKNLHFDRVEQRYPDGLVHSFSLRMCSIVWRGEPGMLIMMQETTQADRARILAMEIARETHRQAEELDAIIMSMAEAVAIFTANRKLSRANQAAVGLFGFDPINFDCLDLIEVLAMRHPDGSPVQMKDLFIQRALLGETVVGQRLLLVDQTGSERMVRVSASPLFQEGAVTAVVTVWHDVTERERLLEQLEVEQSRLETIIHNAPEAILVADEEGRLVLGNPAGAEIFGYPLPFDQDFESLRNLHLCYEDGEPYDPRHLPLICSALDGERLNEVEMQVVQPDGSVRNILASTAPIVDRKGNLNGAVGVFQDITERKREEENLRSQASRSQMLAALSRAFAETGLHYDELLETIVREVGSVFGDICNLLLFADDGQWYYPAAVYARDPRHRQMMEHVNQHMRFRAGEGLTGQVCETGQPLMLHKASVTQAHPPLSPEQMTVLQEALGSSTIGMLIVPLRAHGRRVGALHVYRLQSWRPFTEEDQAFMLDLADRAALAVEDTRLYDREAQRARELEALHSAARSLLSTLELEKLLAQIMESSQQAIPAAVQGILYLLDKESGQMEIRAAFGCRDPFSMRFELQSQAERAAEERRTIILNNVLALPPEAPGLPAPRCSVIIAPLIPAQGDPDRTFEENSQRVLGSLALFGPRPNLFQENDQRMLDSFAAMASTALQNATLHAEVQRLATTDAVTEQYNRRKFFELGEFEMHRYRRFHTPLSAIMLDLDTFKEINDTYGHAAGDQVLRCVAQRCRASIRVVDVLGRYGGDEFAILLPGAEQREALEIAERIRQGITAQPVQTQSGLVNVSISLGVAQASRDTENLSNLLGKADSALYQAKQSGRNRVVQV